MGIDLAFREKDWERVEKAWSARWAGELGRPLVVFEGLDAPPGISVSNIHDLGLPAATFPLDTPAGEVLDYYQERLEAKRYYGDGWPKWWPSFGPGSGQALPSLRQSPGGARHRA